MSMIITNQTKNISQSSNLQSTSCSIDAEDMRYIASLLRNNYSDTILATMREIIANAIDVSGGKKVDVQLPTKIEPNFIVRDYGTGLSEEDMMGLYTKYGKSTKRGSNNAIGGFGIGRFAPLSYTESFVVISINGDSKTSYSIRVDENDDTVVSRLCSESNSGEANGIYVQVPIENQHIENFNLKFKNFSRYLRDNLNVKNNSFDYIEPEISCDVFDFFEDSSDYYYRTSQHAECNNPHILMGGIMYPVNRDDYKNFVKGLVYKADIGEFKLHHSREALEYNNSTVEKLKKASDRIAAALQKRLKAQFDSCDCLYEASKIQHDIVAKYSRFFSKDAVSVDFDTSKFGGEEVSGDLFRGEGLKITKVSPNRNGKLGFSNPRWINNGYFSPSKDKIFIIDDGATPRALANRLSFLGEQEQQGIVIISETEEAKKSLLKRFKLMKSAKVKLLSECERTKTKRTATKRSLGSSLASADILLFDTNSLCYRQSDAWKAQKEDVPDSETYYYVRYHANKFQKLDGEAFGRNGDSPLSNRKFVLSLMSINPDFKNVYGVRSSSLKKVAKMSNWIPLESVYVDWVKNSTEVQDKVNCMAIQETLYERFGFNHSSLCNFTNQLCEKTVSNQIIKNLKNVFKTRDGLFTKELPWQKVLLDLELVEPKITKEKKAVSDFDKKYPLMKSLVRGSVLDADQNLSDVVDYIKNW